MGGDAHAKGVCVFPDFVIPGTLREHTVVVAVLIDNADKRSDRMEQGLVREECPDIQFFPFAEIEGRLVRYPVRNNVTVFIVPADRSAGVFRLVQGR